MAQATQLTITEVRTKLTTCLSDFERGYLSRLNTGDTKDLRHLINVKNRSIQMLVEAMVEAEGKFDLTNLIPFKTPCPDCRGTGELYKFYRTTRMVDCRECTDGYTPCPSCKGTGQYYIHKCRTCDGTGKVKCKKCHGEGKFMIYPIDSKIKSSTTCMKCKGLGFTLPETSANPVLGISLGAKIKESIASKEPEGGGNDSKINELLKDAADQLNAPASDEAKG